jgi:hypothetical protein
MTTLGIAVGAVALVPEDAAACGGFFCNSSQPVNQSAERIIFSHNGDGTITSVIQIQYAGPSESFAWVLPVPGTPTVGVSSDTAFAALQSRTNPVYRMNTTVEGSCDDDARRSGSGGPVFASDGDLDAGSAPGEGAPEAPPVAVLDAGSVGPYDYVTISVNPALEHPADEAVQWLQDHDYDVDDFGRQRLAPYLASGLNLLAFRLTKGDSTGTIRPVMLTYESDKPMIPIRPTAVAADADMGVMVWVLGETRAIPENYLSLEINEAVLNWFSPSANYGALITAAADEAGGQGFVTEMASSTSGLGEFLFDDAARAGWDAFRGQDWTGREGELVLTAIQNYGGWDGMNDVVNAHVPLPDGVSAASLGSCVACPYDPSAWGGYDGADYEGGPYEDYCAACPFDTATETLPGFDGAGFLSAIGELVIAPMAATQALFDRADYLTRFYTTMSAEEMTLDPIFGFNADLGDYSNQHVAERVIHCAAGIAQSEAPWTTTLPSGGAPIRGSGNTWPFIQGSQPANSRVIQYYPAGEGEVVDDNWPAIRAAIDEHNESKRGALCSVAGAVGAGALAPGALLLAAIGVALTWRSRRASRLRRYP